MDINYNPTRWDFIRFWLLAMMRTRRITLPPNRNKLRRWAIRNVRKSTCEIAEAVADYEAGDMSREDMLDVVRWHVQLIELDTNNLDRLQPAKHRATTP